MKSNRAQQFLPIPEFDLDTLIKRSIELLRLHEPPQGYYGCFSGGKDSVVIKELARMAGVRVTWNYNVTTIDPPELVRFIRRDHPDVVWVRPKHGNFFKRASEKKGFPTRLVRWCCEELKEGAEPPGSTLILGIRAEESSRRAKSWSEVQKHHATKSDAILPIFHWASDEIWEFIHDQKIPYCELYDQGFTRLGCVGCPMAGRGRLKEFERWPGFERQWKKMFRRVYERRTGSMQRDGREWFGDAFFTWVDYGWRGGGLCWEPDGAWERMWDWWLMDRTLTKPQSAAMVIDPSLLLRPLYSDKFRPNKPQDVKPNPQEIDSPDGETDAGHPGGTE